MLEALDSVLDGDFNQPSRQESLCQMFERMMGVYAQKTATYMDNDWYGDMNQEDACDHFISAMREPFKIPAGDERLQRRRLVALMANSPAVAGVFAEDSRTIIMPCHPGEALVSIAATQSQVSTEPLDTEALHAEFNRTRFVDADHRMAVWRDRLQNPEPNLNKPWTWLCSPWALRRQPETRLLMIWGFN